MTKPSSRSREHPKSRETSEIVVAGTRFSTSSDTYRVNGVTVCEATWHERLRGARALHQAVCEIYDSYPA